jgi:hypothetical protein
MICSICCCCCCIAVLLCIAAASETVVGDVLTVVGGQQRSLLPRTSRGVLLIDAMTAHVSECYDMFYNAGVSLGLVVSAGVLHVGWPSGAGCCSVCPAGSSSSE